MGNIPNDEVTRAQAALNNVAAKMKFGKYQDPKPFVIAVARELGGNWGLNGKRGNPNDISGDILAWRMPGRVPQLVDVLYDSGGQNKIVWQESPYDQGPAVWIDPFDGSVPDPNVPTHEPSPDPNNPTDPNDPNGDYPTGPILDQLRDAIYPVMVDAMPKKAANRAWWGMSRTFNWILRYAESSRKDNKGNVTDTSSETDVEVVNPE